MRTPLLLIAAIMTLCARLPAADRPTAEFPLWKDGAPLAHGTAPQDIPTLTPYWADPAKATGAAVVVCPGGGYMHLAGHEGRDYALWLNERGITAFVLKYRLGTADYHHPAMMYDVQRALRTVRHFAGDWSIDPHRIGVMGSSAGGHLASTALTHYDDGDPNAADPIDRAGCRPDLGILCYAVITMGEFTHQGSRNALLGNDPDPALVKLMSNELQVTDDTPPTFLWHNRDDPVVPVQNSIQFADALLAHHVPYELHIYQHGPHGQGLGVRGYTPGETDPASLLPWTHDLEWWLRLQGFGK